ncbi:PREDICTED: transcription termination factor MTERF5, chloroplastic-like [Tarenaya hassleriana]|uniref:transcription termination factor MTERF5, chloroplastic-like n=1 Tax=Tarenaya hassleriana TaxID=28532 RepID=UPI00053C471E|nr:PREDICTED: transcription termination factor MTERF5, chloroplastic-like [Tarenaya hassleriana]
MAGLSSLKRVIDSSLYRRKAGHFSGDSGIASWVFGCLNIRAFSSVGDVGIETGNGQKQDGQKLHQVRCLLNEYGFTPEQVTRVSKSFPSAFSANVEVLSPKLAFLRSILGSNDDVARIISANPKMLASSLKNQLLPNYQFIKSILEQDELVAKSIRRSTRILCIDIQNNLGAKVSFFRDNGVPDTSIAKLMEYSPGTFAVSFSKLEESLKKAMALGFEPSNPMIVNAIRAICQINVSTWDRKVELYRKWGWSNDDVLRAFKKHPFIMCISEEKINKGMDFMFNTIGLSLSDIVKYPNIMSFSVEERIIPRFSVVALLLSKGILCDSPSNISTYFGAIRAKEEAFVKKFVDKYPEHVLEVWQKLRRKAAV